MEKLISKYVDKMEWQGLARKADITFLALDDEVVSNRALDNETLLLSKLFSLMNINVVLFAEPSEPYRSIIREITQHDALCRTEAKLVPMDCETRTFFHDIPIVNDFSAEAIASALSRRKAAIIKDRGIVTYGVVTPEQAFVSFSSTCFSTFVKYFYDSLVYCERCFAGKLPLDERSAESFRSIALNARLLQPAVSNVSLAPGPPSDNDDIIAMISEAGRAVVEHKLVDSFFGNISYTCNNTIYISETGSSLDELECCIDAVPLEGTSSVGITASSELSAHKNIYYETGYCAVLHGHPKFSVIMSMLCSKEGCDRSMCHKLCKEKRYISGTPIVSGEIGTGKYGLMHTVPAAIKEGKGAIVYGHGVFTAGEVNFQKPFSMLMDIENTCKREYFEAMKTCLAL